MTIIALVCIYQLAKFRDLLSCGSKDIFKNATCTNSHLDVTDIVNHGVVKNIILRTEHNFSMEHFLRQPWYSSTFFQKNF